jgi:hypothetical protein
MNTLRDRQWLMVAAFLAFASAAFVGNLTVDSGTATPIIWLLSMWAMLLLGAVTVVGVIIEGVMVFLGMLD